MPGLLGAFGEADQGGPCLPSHPSGPRRRGRATPPNRLRYAPLYLGRAAQMGPSFCHPGHAGTRGSPTLRASPQSHLRIGTAPQSPRRPRPPGAWLHILPVELSRARHRLRPADRGPTRSRKCARGVKKNTLSSCRPTGRLDPTPADLASGSLELAALEYRARRGEIIVLYEDATLLWRFALPRLGWWRRAQRPRLPTRPLSQSHIRREELLKRQAWVQSRSWSRVTSGVLLSVIGAVQYGTSKVFYKIVPHFDAQELRQYIHQVMHVFGKTGKEVVMVVDRSGIHRAHKLGATLDHYNGKLQLHLL